MNKQKSALHATSRILYGIGGLSSVTEVVFLLLLLPAFPHVNEAALTVACVCGIGLPVLFMPLCYALINGNTAISTGRYHLIMAASAIASALAFVLMLGIGSKHAVGQCFALIGLLFVYSLGLQVYFYAYAAVGQRFDPGGTAMRSRNVFTMLSAAIAAAVILWLFDSSRDSVRAAFAAAGIVAVISAAVAYLSTAHSMPSFVRLEPKHKRSIKETYARFLSPLKNRTARALIISAFTICAGLGFAAAALPGFVYTHLFGINKGFKLSIALSCAVVVAAGAVFMKILKKRGRRAGSIAAVTAASVQLAAAIAVTVFLFLPLPRVTAAVAFVFAATVGITLGITFVCESGNRVYVEKITDSTPGRYYCFRNCVATLGLSAGTLFACIVRIIAAHTNGNAAAVVACAAYAVLILAGAVLNKLFCEEKTVKTGAGINAEMAEDVVTDSADNENAVTESTVTENVQVTEEE